MSKIIEKLVVSSTAPNNPNVGWVKQKTDRSKELLIHDNNSWTPIGGSNSGGGSDIKVVPSVDDLDPNAKWGTIAKVEGVEYESVKFSELPYVKLEDLNPDGTIKDADRFPRVTNLDLNTGIAADWYDFDYCFLIPRNIDNTSPFSIIMLHPEYEYGGEESWVCYFPNISKGQEVSTDNDGCIWIYNKTPGSTEATFRYFNIGWNIQNIIPKDLTFEQVLAAGDYVMAAPAVLGVTGLCDYMDADDYNIAGISAQLELEVIDKYYLAVTESTFSELYIKKDTWVPLSSGGIDIVDSVDKLDPNAGAGKVAVVAVQGTGKECGFGELYQNPMESIDQSTGIIDTSKCDRVTSISIKEGVTLPSEYEGGMLLAAANINIDDLFSVSVAIVLHAVEGMLGAEIIADGTRNSVILYDGETIYEEELKYVNHILSSNEVYYALDAMPLMEGGIQTDFAILDTILQAHGGTVSTAQIYLKKDKWEKLYESDFNILKQRLDSLTSQTNSLYDAIDDIYSSIDYRMKNKSDVIEVRSIDYSRRILPNHYYTDTISTTGAITYTLVAPNNTQTYSEYTIQLTCNATPSSVLFKYENNSALTIKWANDSAPSFETGCTYIISIVDQYGVFATYLNS